MYFSIISCKTEVKGLLFDWLPRVTEVANPEVMTVGARIGVMCPNREVLDANSLNETYQFI